MDTLPDNRTRVVVWEGTGSTGSAWELVGNVECRSPQTCRIRIRFPGGQPQLLCVPSLWPQRAPQPGTVGRCGRGQPEPSEDPHNTLQHPPAGFESGLVL
ncbi:plexin domain containing 1 [Homo sapiens]|uniref:Plexin domain containing 1 n=1 Tax=Homo sapiens TaxID=9606 RepID=J3KS04_HUMAN|nr:plexin domain containing 1 [Homo sapiens]KAI4049135.1 plexin domain containing 1 [Homo sapiens]